LVILRTPTDTEGRTRTCTGGAPLVVGYAVNAPRMAHGTPRVTRSALASGMRRFQAEEVEEMELDAAADDDDGRVGGADDA
jgi:hypothetical protein